MKKLFRTGLMTALTVILATGWCYAATIMFPYINSNPGNLSTIVSTINTATIGDLGCTDPTGQTLQLHYRYMTKSVDAASIDACEEKDFYRPSTTDDLVTFDAAGEINDGEAMFSDPTDYNDGVGAPSFDLPTQGFSDARRGYLLVNHRCSVDGEVELDGAGQLDGEVMLLDVVNGAAWGYQAILADQDVIGNHAFASASAVNPVTGTTTELLSEDTNGTNNQQVVLYPPDEFQTRFFVTPLVLNVDAIATSDMGQTAKTLQKRTRIRLLNADGIVGVTDRDEDTGSGGGAVHVRCVAGIDLGTLIGESPWFNAQGGWAYADLLDPTALSDAPENESTINTDADHCAIVFKLQFGSPDFAKGSMINSVDIIKTDRIKE